VADRLAAAPALPQAALFAALFFAAAVAMAGMPPLSGFLGKLLILDASRASPAGAWIWAVVLGTSLVVILGFARAGSTLFWKTPPETAGAAPAGRRARALPIAVCTSLVAATALLAAFAGPITNELSATARQVLEPQIYVRAVLPTATRVAALGR
jgi:multicomponent K+:H+ antiporter subunit D